MTFLTVLFIKAVSWRSLQFYSIEMIKSTVVTEHYVIINLMAKENQIMIRVIPINQYVRRKKSSVSMLIIFE